MSFKVLRFSYNGFCGQLKGGYAKYDAEFVRWTRDPGVGVFKCSDGKERELPTFAIDGDQSTLPEQDFSDKILFGNPAES